MNTTHTVSAYYTQAKSRVRKHKAPIVNSELEPVRPFISEREGIKIIYL